VVGHACNPNTREARGKEDLKRKRKKNYEYLM
jgi:hypothetical protein